MKLFKKSLLIVSTLALGLAVSGCSKGNVVSNAYKIKVNTKTTEYESMNKIVDLEVKNYSFIYANGVEKFIKYTTNNGETVVYDFIYNKEVFKTTEEVNTIYCYHDGTVLLITYTDGTKEMRMTNGEVLIPKGEYVSLNSYDAHYEDKVKGNEYSILYFVTETNTVGNREVNYYKITWQGKKNSKKELVIDDDCDSYKLEKVTADDVKVYKTGDDYLGKDSYYNYANTNQSIIFYGNNTSNVTVRLNYGSYGTYSRVLMNYNSNKALVQLAKSTTSTSKYDVAVGSSYYLLDTFLVDAEKGTYERIDDFNYYISTSSLSTIGKVAVARDVYKIKDKTVYDVVNICFDESFKVLETSSKYAYSSTYTDLGNGNYLTTYNSKTYLTNSQGKIKKIYSGNFYVVPKEKIIVISSGSKLSFIDFNGKYITDDVISGNSVNHISDNEIYYTSSVDGESHIITFENKKIVDDRLAGYTIEDSDTTIQNVYYASEMIRYNNYYNRYFYRLTLNDLDNNGIMDNFSATFTTFSGASLGKTDNVNYFKKMDVDFDADGDSCEMYFATQTLDSTYRIQIYELK